MLDELFAKTRLPRKAPVRATGEITVDPPPVDSPTTLDPDALEQAWKRSRDQLLLSYTQSFTAVSWGPWVRDDAAVAGLMEPALWTTDFEVTTRANIGGTLYAFGQFMLGDTFAGSNALAGLTARFKLDGLRLLKDDKLEERPVRVVGFATGLWNASDDG